MSEREELIQKYQMIATERNCDYVSKDEFLRQYALSTSDILRAGFDGWTGLVLAAGGKVSTSKQIYSNDDLLDDLLAVASRFGQLPTRYQYEAFGKFSISNIKNRFGSWLNALEAASGKSETLKPRQVTPQPKSGADKEAITVARKSNVAKQRNVPTRAPVEKFSLESRLDVDSMSAHYAKLYCLERQKRSTIAVTLQKSVGDGWWDTSVPQEVRDGATRNLKAEERLGVTPRSDRLIDYTTLGELGVIVDANWKHFSGVFKNQEAMKRIMRDLNMLRAFVAHCSPLPVDEVTRLDLNTNDWLRQLR